MHDRVCSPLASDVERGAHRVFVWAYAEGTTQHRDESPTRAYFDDVLLLRLPANHDSFDVEASVAMHDKASVHALLQRAIEAPHDNEAASIDLMSEEEEEGANANDANDDESANDDSANEDSANEDNDMYERGATNDHLEPDEDIDQEDVDDVDDVEDVEDVDVGQEEDEEDDEGYLTAEEEEDTDEDDDDGDDGATCKNEPPDASGATGAAVARAVRSGEGTPRASEEFGIGSGDAAAETLLASLSTPRRESVRTFERMLQRRQPQRHADSSNDVSESTDGPAAARSRALALELEAGCVNYSVAYTKKRTEQSWDNPLFRLVYRYRSKVVARALAGNARFARMVVESAPGAVREAASGLPDFDLLPSRWDAPRKAVLDRRHATDKLAVQISSSDQCERCEKYECVRTEVQTRSADEAMTVIIRCMACGHVQYEY